MKPDELDETRDPYCAKPWRRYLAKSIDISIFTVFTGAVVGVAAGLALPSLTFESRITQWSLVVAAVILAIPLEAACISRFGTTFGKFLMSTRVVGGDGANTPFVTALRRTFKSYALGLALGVPVASLFALMAGYNQLENEGVTYWDRSENTFVVHDAMKWWNWSIGLLLVGLFFAFQIYEIFASR